MSNPLVIAKVSRGIFKNVKYVVIIESKEVYNGFKRNYARK